VEDIEQQHIVVAASATVKIDIYINNQLADNGHHGLQAAAGVA